jgi:glutamyl-tRNA synthetase
MHQPAHAAESGAPATERASDAGVRTRFAPSPTGSLHLGNLRIAVFNHLFARHHGGAFVIRVEDTDQDRNVEGSLGSILEDLAWAGLAWDEGPDRGGPWGPYRQSERGERHAEVARTLLDQGKAYLCFCPDPSASRSGTAPEGEGEARGPDGAPPPGCPGGCHELAPERARERARSGEAAAIRFPVPEREIAVEDAIRGTVRFHGSHVADFVILRADGRPTYNFAVVVDDVDMRISHVIRGAGHLSNTPKQALLFDAMGAPRPVFAHLPTVLGPDGKKLSKRAGSAGVAELRARGYLPDAVVNYLSLLGWSPGEDREVLERSVLVAELSLDRVGASDTVFDPEKLRWMSGQHLALLPLEAVVEAVRPFLDADRFPQALSRLPLVIAAIRTRLEILSDVNGAVELLYPGEPALREGAREAGEEAPGAARALLGGLRDALAAVNPWDAEVLARTVREAGKALGARGPALFHPFRLALCGARSGPDMGLVLAALGREETLRRLDAAGDALPPV